MALPLSPIRSHTDSTSFITSAFEDKFNRKDYKIVRGIAALSKDGREFYGIHEDVDGDYRLPKSVKIIKKNSFKNNKSIRFIYVPPTISIEARAFDFKSLIVYYDITPIVSDVAGEGYFLTPKKIVRDTKKERKALEEFVDKKKLPQRIKNYLTSQNKYLGTTGTVINPFFVDCDLNSSYSTDFKELIFYRLNHKSYRIANGVEVIGFCAIQGDIKILHIPKSVKKLDYFSIAHCDVLTEVHFDGIPDSIHDTAFQFDKNLKTIYIPKGYYNQFIQLMPSYKDLIVEKG